MALIEHLSLSERVANEIGSDIVSGTYKFSDVLPTEAQLCENYGVSRTAVREAVKMLTAKGLVSSRKRRGICVEPPKNWSFYDRDILSWMLERNPSQHIINELFQMRMAFEPLAAALAAKRNDATSHLRVNSALNSMRINFGKDDKAFKEGQIAFHSSVLLASGNRFLGHLSEFITTAMRVKIKYLTTTVVNQLSIFERYEKTYSAICIGDSDRAKFIMALIIDEALQAIDIENARFKETTHKLEL